MLTKFSLRAKYIPEKRYRLWSGVNWYYRITNNWAP